MYAALGSAFLAGAGPALWALNARPEEEAGAPRIDYGHDRCVQCGMVIGDRRFASAVRDAGATFLYDDIGCMLEHRGSRLASGTARGFVHDTTTLAWLAAGDAWYVRSPAIRTPMNHQIAAFADPAAARSDFPTATPLAWKTTLRGGARGGS
jgi:copper chaperone NosL